MPKKNNKIIVPSSNEPVLKTEEIDLDYKNKNIVLDFIIELVMTIIFILSVQFLSRWWACLAYGCALIAYFCINYKKVASMFRDIKRIFF